MRRIDPAPAVFEESLPWWGTLDTSGRLRTWLNALRWPVGIFASNDAAGLKLADFCRDSGIQVPDSLAILAEVTSLRRSLETRFKKATGRTLRAALILGEKHGLETPIMNMHTVSRSAPAPC